jgi:hypothetical protein
MEQPTRVLVAVIAVEAGVHTLYFNDGLVVGYEPDRGTVTRVHQLPTDFGPAAAVPGPARLATALPLEAVLRPSDRRRENTPPTPGGKRADDSEV